MLKNNTIFLSDRKEITDLIKKTEMKSFFNLSLPSFKVGYCFFIEFKLLKRKPP